MKKQTGELVEQPHDLDKLICPKCGANVRYYISAGRRKLHRHHNRNIADQWAWCPGSDRDIDEVQA